MRRREFIAGLGAAGATVTPIAVWAHSQTRGYRVAWLSVQTVPARWQGPFADAVFDQLQRSGYVQGKNLTFTQHFYQPDLSATELERRLGDPRPDVIIAWNAPKVRALKAANITVPIVAWMFDPVIQGFAESLARPGGTVTGLMSDPVSCSRSGCNS